VLPGYNACKTLREAGWAQMKKLKYKKQGFIIYFNHSTILLRQFYVGNTCFVPGLK
jgi:hypothetical protein